EEVYMNEVKKFTQELLQRDPNSYDGHRLVGDWNYARATEAYRTKRPEDGQKFLEEATAEYRRADQIKPGQQGVSMQLARAFTAKGQFDEAERLYRSVIEKDKTFQYAYSEMYRMFGFEQKPEQG